MTAIGINISWHISSLCPASAEVWEIGLTFDFLKTPPHARIWLGEAITVRPLNFHEPYQVTSASWKVIVGGGLAVVP